MSNHVFSHNTKPTNPKGRGRQLGVSMFLGLIGTTLGLLVITLSIDASMADLTTTQFLEGLTSTGLQNAMSSLAEVLAAVLGLTLTVVAIVVQLASQRYSPKVADLFMRDPTNLGFFAFMVVSCTYVVLLPAVSGTQTVPQVAFATGLFLCVANFGCLLPYFAHVFAFLRPGNIIDRMEADAERSVAKLRGVTIAKPAELADAQKRVAVAIERISDSCLAAIKMTDRHLALHTVHMLEQLLCNYLRMEPELPENWNVVPRDYFFMLSQEFYDEIVEQRTWVEAKAMYEFEHALRHSLHVRNYDIIGRIAASSRAVGVTAVEIPDSHAVALVIRFFNTYLRHSLNARDVRSIYNILYQYRLLAVELIDNSPEAFERITEHFVYYGKLFQKSNLPFATITVAHDLRALFEASFDMPSIDSGKMLDMILSVGIDEASGDTLIDVRNAQAMLGAFLVEQGAQALASKVREHMQQETPERLLAIRDGLLAIKESKFWEITDRGINFNFVPMERRQHLEPFFAPLLAPS